MKNTPTPTRRTAAFTITDLLVVLAVVAAMLALQLPTNAAARRTARRIQNSTQLRGIHQGLITFANSNKNKYPGLNSKGLILADGQQTTGNSGDGDTVQARYWIMLHGDFFTPEYAISPSEVDLVTEVEHDWRNNQPPPTVRWDDRVKNYSYAMLDIHGDAGQAPEPRGRGAEWAQTINSQAVVLSDRNTGANATDRVQSIHTDAPGDWRGSVLWNDNHVQFENEQVFLTKYDNGRLHMDERTGRPTDNLFSAEQDADGSAGYDALMPVADDNIVHAGAARDRVEDANDPADNPF